VEILDKEVELIGEVEYAVSEAMKWPIYDRGSLYEKLVDTAGEELEATEKSSSWWGEVKLEGKKFIVSIYVGEP